MPLKWIVSAKQPYQFFIPEQMAHGAEIAEESAPIGKSGYEGVSNLRAARLQLGKAGARVGRRRRADRGSKTNAWPR